MFSKYSMRCSTQLLIQVVCSWKTKTEGQQPTDPKLFFTTSSLLDTVRSFIQPRHKTTCQSDVTLQNRQHQHQHKRVKHEYAVPKTATRRQLYTLQTQKPKTKKYSAILLCTCLMHYPHSIKTPQPHTRRGYYHIIMFSSWDGLSMCNITVAQLMDLHFSKPLGHLKHFKQQRHRWRWPLNSSTHSQSSTCGKIAVICWPMINTPVTCCCHTRGVEPLKFESNPVFKAATQSRTLPDLIFDWNCYCFHFNITVAPALCYHLLWLINSPLTCITP